MEHQSHDTVHVMIIIYNDNNQLYCTLSISRGLYCHETHEIYHITRPLKRGRVHCLVEQYSEFYPYHWPQYCNYGAKFDRDISRVPCIMVYFHTISQSIFIINEC